MILARRLALFFSKASRPKPKPKSQEVLRSFAVGDDKAAKLSKAEQEMQNKKRALEAEKIEQETSRRTAFMRTHDPALQEFKTKEELQQIRYYQELYLTGSSRNKPTARVDVVEEKEPVDFLYSPMESPTYDQLAEKWKKHRPEYGNYVSQVNSGYELTEFEGRQEMRRMGTLGVKMGMTTMYDSWGYTVPVTVILLDRVQVVQIKPPVNGNEFFQVQMGIGQKRLKKCLKPQLGHFLKARVPPKAKLAEFSVSQQCLLPIGYMMSSRHYTPGMFVDIAAKTVGHGFSGTIKKDGFHRQPASHGNSLTTRVLGSTGGRQDPGRVFKGKKMYGRMGGKVSVQKGMTIFKIDVDKNILYIKGSVPGKAGTIVKIWDTLMSTKGEKNMILTHYPTFVEQPGVTYARQFSMYCGERDPDEIEIHDNAFIVDNDAEDAGEAQKKEEVDEQ